MAKLNIAYGYNLAREFTNRLEALSPDVALFDVTELVDQEYKAAAEFGSDSAEGRAATEKVDNVIKEVDIYYSARLPKGLTRRAPKLRWLQYVWDGIDLDVGKDILESPIILTNARHLAALNIAEWVVMVILMFAKRQHDQIVERHARFWSNEFYNQVELKGKTVGVVGLGAIGGRAATLFKAFGMKVLATRRSANSRSYNVGDVDEVMPASELDDLLTRSDFVALCVPGTPNTSQLIGERELKLIGPSSYLVNVARGSVVDEIALTRALKDGWIAGAGLDVFATEPLPQDSELWDLHNVVFGSHKTGDVKGYDDRIADLFTKNVERYIRGDELLNLVDKKVGY